MCLTNRVKQNTDYIKRLDKYETEIRGEGVFISEMLTERFQLSQSSLRDSEA